MKIKCISKSPNKYHPKGNIDATYDRITMDEEYYVYAICSFDNQVMYLILDDDDDRYWVPAPIFEVIDNQIPRNWIYNYYSEFEYHVEFLFGYPELVNSKNHYEGLIELIPKHIQIFEKESS